jgi:hypothetical protein
VKANDVAITRKSSDCVIGFTDSLAVAFWRLHTKPQDILELQRVAGQAYEASGKPIALVQVVPVSAIAPDGQARAALARLLGQLNGRVSRSAIVHEGEGFRAAMIRSIVTGVVALSNPGFPHRVFSTLAESVTWMAQADPRFDASKITSAVTKVRATTAIEIETPRQSY